jgi:hypothetical protein
MEVTLRIINLLLKELIRESGVLLIGLEEQNGEMTRLSLFALIMECII